MVIATALGLLFLLRPTTVYHYVIYLYGGADTGRGGRWGEDPTVGDTGRLVIRVLGVVLLAIAVALALSPWWREAVF